MKKISMKLSFEDLSLVICPQGLVCVPFVCLWLLFSQYLLICWMAAASQYLLKT